MIGLHSQLEVDVVEVMFWDLIVHENIGQAGYKRVEVGPNGKAVFWGTDQSCGSRDFLKLVVVGLG